MKNLSQYLGRSENERVSDWINVNLFNYLKKNSENQSEIEHIIDYLNSSKAPKELKGLQYNNALINARKWVKAMNKKGRNVVETESDTKVILDFEDGFKLVELVTSIAYKREGALMSHCCSDYADKDCKVYSLRDTKNNPHCTIEVNSSETGVEQIKGKGNGSIHPKYIKYVIDILKYFKMDIRDNEMRNLGYILVDENYKQMLEKFYKNTKYCYFNDKIYLFNKGLK